MSVVQTVAPAETAVLRKIALRLVPFMGLLYFCAYLDRVNIGFAALTMNHDIGLSAAAYGLGSGIFFVGYFIFEVPSNLILEKVGARRWIARIMVTWGLLSAGMAFVSNPTGFYVVRFLLGVAEAGFFPGMILYLTYWFPWEQRGRIVAMFMLAIPLSSVLGAPVSTALLDTSILGFKGWQTMFLLEGVPAALLGIAVLFRMTDKPSTATWLDDAERETLQAALDRDRTEPAHGHMEGLLAALSSLKVWRFGLVYFGIIMGNYGLGFWLPQIIKGFGGLSNQQTGLMTALPYLLGAIGMFLWGRHSDRTGERTWHFVGPCVAGAAAFTVAGLSADTTVQYGALIVATICVNMALPMFWSFPTSFLRATAAAGGIALINAVGNLAGYAGPSIMGWLKESTGGFGAGILVLAGALTVAAALAAHQPALRRAKAQP